MKEILLIIAAGKGTRMGNDSVPKALHKVNGKVNLDNTLSIAKDIYDEIYIISSNQHKDMFKQYHENVVSISSGLGDGHAILEALRELESEISFSEYNATIIWGDTYVQNEEIFKEIISKKYFFSVPTIMEKDPYVSFATDDRGFIQHTLFSKCGEKQRYGFHDQSVFRTTNLEKFHDDLYRYHSFTWKGSRYTTENGELNMLNLLHYFYNMGYPAKLYITDHETYSYNTPEELQKIENNFK